jgi:predicted site-specific integrase-resolvase
MGVKAMEVYLRLPQVEKLTGVDAVTLWRMCRRGILPHRRNGRFYEVRLSDVEKLAAAAELIECAKHSTIRQAVALARAGIRLGEEP